MHHPTTHGAIGGHPSPGRDGDRDTRLADLHCEVLHDILA